MDVPESFPKEPWPAAIGGSPLKDSARLIGGKYVVGLTSEERLGRYRACAEVVEKILTFCRRKLAENPGLTRERLLHRVDAALLIEAPDLSLLEQAWCLAQVKEGLCNR